jgi:hypothetical protein
LKIQWVIKGPYHDDKTVNPPIYGVFDTNLRTVQKAMATMPGIQQKLSDLTQFAIIG